MTISVAIRIEGQAAGLPYQATAAQAISATLDSVADVNSVAWTVAGGDDLASAASYTLVASGVKGETVALTTGAVGTALILQAVVNADPTLYARAKVFVPAANGLETGADGEGYEGDATHGTARIQNEAIRASGVGSAAAPTVTVKSEATAAGAGVAVTLLRSDAQIQAATAAPVSIGTANAQGAASTLARSNHVHDHGAQTDGTHHAAAVAAGASGFMTGADKTKLDGITAGAAVASVSGTAPIASSGGTTPAISISAASGTDPGSMSAAHYTLVAGATATPTASTIAKWGASVDLGAAFFYGVGTVAGAGLLRAANNVVVASARNAANGANIALVTSDGSDRATFGDAANAVSADLSALTVVRTLVGGAVSTHATADGLSVGMAPSFGGGVGVLGLVNRTTAPSTAPTGGVVVSAVAGSAEVWSPKKLKSTLSPETNSAATDQRLDRVHQSLNTTDTTLTTILTYALPTACAAVFRVAITGQQTGTDTRCAYTLDASTGRAAGGAAVDGAPTAVTLVDAIGVAAVPVIVASGNNILVRLQGKAGPTSIDWQIQGVVYLFSV